MIYSLIKVLIIKKLQLLDIDIYNNYNQSQSINIDIKFSSEGNIIYIAILRQQ